MQTCPALKKIALATPGMARSRSVSGRTIAGDLPPSSSVTRLKLVLAASRIARPVWVEPVNAILSTPGCAERSAGLAAEPGDDVEHARGQPRLRDQFAEPEGAERGVLRRLQDDRAASCQRWGELHRGQDQRRVPRHDCGNDADGFAESPGRDLLARGLVIDRAFDRVALDRHRLAGEEAELVDRAGDLRSARDEQRRALVERFQRGEFVDMGLD